MSVTESYTPERLELLKVAVPALLDSLGDARIYTAFGDASCKEPKLVIEIELNDPTAARFADLIFHGTPEALEVNGYTALMGLTEVLPRSVCRLCKSLRGDA